MLLMDFRKKYIDMSHICFLVYKSIPIYMYLSPMSHVGFKKMSFSRAEFGGLHPVKSI